MTSKWAAGQLEEVPILTAWKEYSGWFAPRGKRPPLPTLSGIFIGRGELVCGCLLYPTAGPYLFVEHAATNPLAPLRLRHRAFRCMLESIKEAAQNARQTPVMLVGDSLGMSRLLAKAGFQVSPTVQWVLP